MAEDLFSLIGGVGATGNPVGTADRSGGGFFSNLGNTFSDLSKDRNFLSLLAGMGAKFGAGGAGEAIGVPTQSLIQNLAAQEASGKQEEGRTKFNDMVRQLLAGLTPQDQPGPTALKATGDKLSIDVTPPILVPETSTPASAQITPGGLTPEAARPKLSDIIPFF